MKYKGYLGDVTYDDDAEIFHGSVVGIKDVVTYQGRSVDELKQAFKDSVNDYLEFCKQRGEKPDKPYSGKFNLRISPELHAKIDIAAKEEGESLNNFVSRTLRRAVGE
ncbi:type II toxin-antitoxin system HicB family antitoxin [Candidatus Neptunochlamydia vexilliferae]